MSAPIPHFIALEVRNVIDRVSLVGFVASVGRRAAIAVRNIVVVIHVTAEVGRPMKPRPHANEYAASEPFRAIVAIGSAGVRSVIVVAVRAIWGDSDANADLSCRFGG